MAFEETRFVYVQLMLDTNAINARQSDPDLNQIERWRANEVVLVVMSSHSSGEARAGGNAVRAAKAVSYVYSYIGDRNDEERVRKQAMAAVLSPKGVRTDAERNDVDICFHAHKYKAILVTKAVFSIDPVECIGGDLPRAQRRLVEAWAEIHRRELMQDWALLQAGRSPVKIEPLR